MSEIWELYDRNRRLTGVTLERGKPLPRGSYHLCVEIMTVNMLGEILTTKRHPAKKGGLKWEITGGSAIKGEESRTAAVRELFEETGIKAEESELHYVGTMFYEASFADFYIVRKDYSLESLTLQKTEVIDAKWVTESGFEDIMNSGGLIRPTIELYKRYKRKIHEFIEETAEEKV